MMMSIFRFVIAGAGMESAVLPCSAAVFRFDTEYGLTQEEVYQTSLCIDYFGLIYIYIYMVFKLHT